MEAAQIWDLLANWRSRRTNGVVSVQRPIGLKPRGGNDVSDHVQRQEESDVPEERQSVRQKKCLLTQRRISLLLYSGLHLIGWGPLRIRKAICFTQSTNLYLSLVQSLLTDTSGITFDRSVSGNSLAQSSWHKIFIIMLLCHCEALILENLGYLSNFTHSQNIYQIYL